MIIDLGPLPDEAMFVCARPLYDGTWNVVLGVQYEIKNSWGSSLGGQAFGGFGPDPRAATTDAAQKLLEYVERERVKPRPKVLGRLSIDPIDSDQLLAGIKGRLKSH